MASYAKSMSTCCLKNSKSIVSCIKGLSQGFFATFFGFSNYFYCIPCLFASVCCNDGIAVGIHGNHALFCLGIPVFSPPCKNRLGQRHLFLHHSATWSPSRDKFLFIRSAFSFVVCSWSRYFRNAWSNSAILRSLFHTLSHSCTIGTSLCKKLAPAIPLPNILKPGPAKAEPGY